MKYRNQAHRLTVACLSLMFSTTSLSAVFTVNQPLDGTDNNPGDGICSTAGGFCTVRAAIQESNALAGQDTITIPAGTFQPTIGNTGENAAAEGDFDIFDDVIISGAGPDQTTITGTANEFRIFHILKRDDESQPVVTIKNLTLTQGLENADGSVIRNNANLTLDNITVTDAGAGSNAIYNNYYRAHSRLTIRNAHINSNTRGIYNDQGVVLIENTGFNGNKLISSGADGAALYSNKGWVTIKRSTFTENISPDKGGAIAANSTSAYLSGNTFEANVTAGSGGALYATSSNLIIQHDLFRNNQSNSTRYGGGAIYVEFGTTRILDTQIL